jgi:hypothetical protein
VNRDSIIKALAALAAAALVLFVGFALIKVYVLNPKGEDMSGEPQAATLDANLALKSAIDSLEQFWESRQAYVFKVSDDPLYLPRVIKDYTFAQGSSQEAEEEEDIRLTATVVDSNPKAIIKYNSNSYVVRVGDWLGTTYRVISIEKKQVVLDHGGNKKILMNKPLQTDTEGSNFSTNSDDPGLSNY